MHAQLTHSFQLIHANRFLLTPSLPIHSLLNQILSSPIKTMRPFPVEINPSPTGANRLILSTFKTGKSKKTITPAKKFFHINISIYISEGRHREPFCSSDPPSLISQTQKWLPPNDETIVLTVYRCLLVYYTTNDRFAVIPSIVSMRPSDMSCFLRSGYPSLMKTSILLPCENATNIHSMRISTPMRTAFSPFKTHQT